MRAVLASATAALVLTTALVVGASLTGASVATATSQHTAPGVTAQLPITDDLDGFQLPTR